jgi:hypothetical protein
LNICTSKWIDTVKNEYTGIQINAKHAIKAAARDAYKGWLKTLHESTDLNCTAIQKLGCAHACFGPTKRK